MERKIGEKFTIDGKTYIVVEEESNHVCEGCVCRNSHYTECLEFVRRFAGDCSMESRTDGKDVIFKEIKQNNTNMKPFNLEAAKAGKTVCTRDGNPVRIICYDCKGGDNTRIVALIDVNGVETPMTYYEDGKVVKDNVYGIDLMMAPEKKKGWMNMYRTKSESCIECAYTSYIYNTKEDALAHIIRANNTFVGTFPIEWEE